MNSTDEAATARARIAAFGIDYALICAYLVALAALGLGLSLSTWGGAWHQALAVPWRMQLLAFGTTVLPVTLYFALSEAGPHAASVGKRRRHLHVSTSIGERPSLARTLLRNALKFLPWQLAHTAMLAIPGFPARVEVIPNAPLATLVATWVLVALYLAGLSSGLGRRPLYDRIAGTVVRRA